MLPVHLRPLIFLLFGHSLVLATDICQTAQPYDDATREELVKAHNELRKTIAEGNLPNQQGTLPPAKNMYKLVYDCKMEEEVQKELAGCSGHATLSEKYGQNYLVVPGAYMAAGTLNRLKAAIAIWQGPQTYYGLKNFSNYDDNRLYTFANMAHAKTLRFACGYKEDCGAQPAQVLHISCIYNLIGGFPNSVLYERGRKCTKHKDCTTYEGSTCDTADTNLCVFKGKPPVPGGGENKMCPNNKQMTDPGRKAVLYAHNTRRSQLAKGEVRNGKNPKNGNLKTASFMPRMVYDCDAEAGAIDYASTCALKQSPPSERKGYGENVYVYKSPNAVPADAFKAAAKKWWDQIFLDGINWEVVFKKSLRDKTIDQKGFTQMAWANSVKIGCGVQTCDTKSFVVCRYSPAGNILNQTIYPIGEVCSGCKAACNASDGLCM